MLWYFEHDTLPYLIFTPAVKLHTYFTHTNAGPINLTQMAMTILMSFSNEWCRFMTLFQIIPNDLLKSGKVSKLNGSSTIKEEQIFQQALYYKGTVQ